MRTEATPRGLCSRLALSFWLATRHCCVCELVGPSVSQLDWLAQMGCYAFVQVASERRKLIQLHRGNGLKQCNELELAYSTFL